MTSPGLKAIYERLGGDHAELGLNLYARDHGVHPSLPSPMARWIGRESRQSEQLQWQPVQVRGLDRRA